MICRFTWDSLKGFLSVLDIMKTSFCALFSVSVVFVLGTQAKHDKRMDILHSIGSAAELKNLNLQVILWEWKDQCYVSKQ